MKLFHWKTKRLIEKYLNRTLSDEKRQDFELHLGNCSDCQGELQWEKQFLEKLMSAGRTIGPSEASWERTHARILALPPHKPKPQENVTKIENLFDWMKNWRIAGIAAGSLAISIIVYIFLTSIMIPGLTPVKITGLLGNGFYLQSANGTKWEKVASKIHLENGDRIQTDEYTQVAVELGNTGEVWVNRSSQLSLLDNASIALTLQNGEVDVKVKRHVDNFQVQTPAGVVHVYGTEFHISVDSMQNTIVTCIEHTVYFENAYGKVTITAGYQSSANPQTAPSAAIAVETTHLLDWRGQFNRFNRLSINQRKIAFQTYLNQGDNYYSKQEYLDALENYRTAVSLNPTKDNGYFGVGRTYRMMGEFAQATTEYLSGIEKNPSNGLLVYQLTQCLLELKEYDTAEKYLIQLINTNEPNYVDVWVSLGDTYLLEDNFDKAQETYQQAISKGALRVDYVAAQVYGGLAEIERHNQNYQKAQEDLDKAYHCKVIPSIVYLEAARLYRDLHDKDKEITSWKYYLQTDPKGAFARDAQNRLKELESVTIVRD